MIFTLPSFTAVFNHTSYTSEFPRETGYSPEEANAPVSDLEIKACFFEIRVSGKESVYYTLWYVTPNDEEYICNLSIDLEAAKEKALIIAGGVHVETCLTKTHERRTPGTMPFGKYKGMEFCDIVAQDRAYMMWWAKDVISKYETNHRYGSEKNAKIAYKWKRVMMDAITQENLEKGLSVAVGEIGERITLEKVTITNIKNGTNEHYGDYRIVSFENEDGNKFKTFGSSAWLDDVKEGDQFGIKGTVKKHDEYLGIVSTVLNRVTRLK